MNAFEIDNLSVPTQVKEYMKAGCQKCKRSFEIARSPMGVYGYCPKCEPAAALDGDTLSMSITKQVEDNKGAQNLQDFDNAVATAVQSTSVSMLKTTARLAIYGILSFGSSIGMLVLINYLKNN
jgi:ribosomal protein L37AE/L43A